MPDENARLRNQLLQLRRNLPDRVHPVMNEVDLPAAFQFLLDGGLNQLVIPAGDDSLDRHAIFGRRLDDAHVAQADQRHVQRARDRRGRHGQHVHLLAHLLDALFVAHPEALLLIHDQQAEIGELQILRKNAVRADQDVDLAGFGFLQDFFLLLGIAEAADHFDGDRERPEALLESFVVLERENGRRREHRDLLVVADRFECRAHRDFRLAVTDVAA